MEEFEELQPLWQNQAIAPGPSAEKLVSELRGYSRRQRGRMFKATVLGMFLLGFAMFPVVLWSTPATIGGVLVVTGVAVVLAMDWRTHLAVAHLEFTASSAGFARAFADRLRRIEKLRPAQYCGLLLAVTGMNVALTAFLPGRVLANVLGSLVVLASAWCGIRARAQRFQIETRPLLERLESFGHSGWD